MRIEKEVCNSDVDDFFQEKTRYILRKDNDEIVGFITEKTDGQFLASFDSECWVKAGRSLKYAVGTLKRLAGSRVNEWAMKVRSFTILENMVKEDK